PPRGPRAPARPAKTRRRGIPRPRRAGRSATETSPRVGTGTTRPAVPRLPRAPPPRARAKAPRARASSGAPVALRAWAVRGAPDAVEDSVHERARGGRRELLRDLDGFVDDDRVRRVVLVEELVEREPEKVSVHGRHAPEPPMLGALGELRIQL